MERSLLIIQPQVNQKESEIIDSLLTRGYTILARRRTLLTQDQAIDLFQAFMTDSTFNDFIENITSGPILGLLLSRKGIHSDLQDFLGTLDESIRNGLYKSDQESAQRDILFFFPNTYSENLPSFDVSKTFIEDSVYPTLLKGLTELAKVKPASPTVWLGNWLMDNNPHKPIIQEPLDSL